MHLRANLNARDEDGDTALHIVLTKRNNLNGEIIEDCSPTIYEIYERNSNVTECRLAVAIACYLIQMGIDMDALNRKNQGALNILLNTTLQELIKSYKPSIDNNQINQDVLEPFANLSLDSRENYNLNECPREALNNEQANKQIKQKQNDGEVPVRDGSPNHKKLEHQIDNVIKKPVECSVCSEFSEENVLLEPCHHKPACEDCSSRMKKCLHCGVPVQKRVTKDGRVIPPKSRQPSAERMRYLECKIAEIEESHACSICMEKKRNVVFLCGHGTCAKCADTLKTCHMCRKTITKKIPIY